MAIFVDASPLICLARINRLDLFTILPGPVSVTPVVWSEVTGDATKPGVAALEQARAQGIIAAVTVGNAADYPLLGRGEAETLSAARQERAAVIVDDAEARRMLHSDPALVAAISSSLTTVELVIIARRLGYILLVKPLLDALIAEKLYLHLAVYEQALRVAGEWPV